MSATENQEVNFSYGFELRGQRSVERGLDSILERFARTGSVAETAAFALTKFGRVFEVGIPIALGAAAIGMLGEKMYQVGEQAIETREKIDRLTSQPVELMDSAGISSNIDAIANELDEIATGRGKKFGESFLQAMEVGSTKFDWNVDAFVANNFYGQHIPGYDEGSGQTQELFNAAKYDQIQLKKQQDDDFQRTKRRDDVNALLSGVQDVVGPDGVVKGTPLEKSSLIDQRTRKGKFAAADLEQGLADENVTDDNNKIRRLSQQQHDLGASMRGRAETADDVRKEQLLDKQIFETKKELYADLQQQHEAQQKITNLTKQDEEFHRGDVVAASGRRLGGGGNVWSSRSSSAAVLAGLGTNHLSAGPQNPNAFNPGSINHDVMKDFNDALKDHTQAIQKQNGLVVTPL
jgi:hypothetical protein